MRQFMKYVIATICGVALFFVGIYLLFFIFVSIVALAGSGNTSIDKHSILRIELTGNITEQAPAENPFAEIIGNDVLANQGLDVLIKAVRDAKDNDNIDAIYLEGGMVSTDWATLQYLRGELEAFKKSGKKIVAYADQYTQPSYYIASVADTVAINPQGMLDWHGIASQPIFYTGLLEKIGVKMQVFKVGTYKSAVEPYILNSMSDANREQVESYISDIWNEVTHAVSKSRKISVDSLNAYADNYVALAEPKSYKAKHLVDKISYVDEVREMLRAIAGENDVHFVTPTEVVAAAKAKEKNDGDAIAVYYAQGDIVDEAATTSFSEESQIVGNTVVEDLDRLANDDDVKAVVLRINSGGGSAYASEQMWRAIQLMKKKKPVVVSMSGMAASGGYYMSCGADYIVAEPSTLTGSIGIFGMIPDVSGLLKEKLGLSFDVVKTNESSDFGASGRPFNASESDAMQQYVNRGYRTFITRVADGRTAAGHKMTIADVDSIGQGRVWTGNQALKLGLVDQLGTLDDAIAKAAKLAKVEKYYTDSYPAPASWMDKFMDAAKQKDYLEERVKTTLGEYYAPLSFVLNADNNSMLQTRIFYLPNLK